MEASSLVQLTDRTGIGAATTRARNEIELSLYHDQVHFGLQRHQPFGVQHDPRVQKAAGTAEEDYPSVDKFLSLNVRDNAQHGVII
jgi:hypothetical protein